MPDKTTLTHKRAEHEAALKQTLDRVVTRLSAMPQVERVVLFGSYAAGRRDLFTDLDLLVVMASERDFVSRTAELYQQLDATVDLDLLVYTPEEFEQVKGRSFVRRALETGKVLYERGSAERG